MSNLQQMLDDIELDAQLTAEMTGRSAFSPDVMAAMASVPRDQFVPLQQREQAYYNIPLPIGYGQTISQPYIVALMTDLLNPRPHHRCLEVGTGSGYQAAVLSCLVQQVFSVEIVTDLYKLAAQRLQQLGYDNICCVLGDESPGYPEQAPYDGILVTAAAEVIPAALVSQLKPGGRMVIPVGPPHMGQQLYLLTKNAKGDVEQRAVLAVRFVPLITPRVSRLGDEPLE